MYRPSYVGLGTSKYVGRGWGGEEWETGEVSVKRVEIPTGDCFTVFLGTATECENIMALGYMKKGVPINENIE